MPAPSIGSGREIKAAVELISYIRISFLGLVLLPMVLSASAHAETQRYPSAGSPADDFMRSQTTQELEERLDVLREATPDHQTTAKPPLPVIFPDTGAGPCSAISQIEVDGVTLLEHSALARIIAPYHNKCLGLSEINILLRDLTDLYVEKGYVAARIYVPAQDTSNSHILRLVANEGTLSDIYLNGSPTKEPQVLGTAFPGMKGKPVNMRGVEQGLDQINRLSSNAAKSAMLPGNKDGTSILNIENQPTTPWHFSVSNSNLGQRSTGYSKTTIGFRMDNLVGLNDLLSLNFDHSGGQNLWRDDGLGHSNSLSGTFSVPYGYWSFTVNGSLYKYQSTVPGNYGDVDSSGNSGQIGMTLDRVVMRDKDSITTLNTGLTYKTTDNFLLGNRLEVGSRQYSVASLGLSHSTRALNGLWVFDVNYARGLKLFDAVRRGEPGAGDAEPEFSKVSGTVSVTEPLQFGHQNLQITTMVNGQYSPNNLFGSEQISLGGYSNVRGTRDGVLFGNNGAFIRNELVWRVQPWASHETLKRRLGELRPYVGLDYGHVFRQERYGIDGGNITGFTAGTRLSGGNIGADIGYSHLIKSSNEAPQSELFYITTSLQW